MNPTGISLGEQQQRLLTVYPGSFCVVRGDELAWQGTIQPEETSRCYLANVSYRAGLTPRVRIIRPSLHEIVSMSGRPGRTLPHTYREPGDPLCLFVGAHEWNPNLLIAETTVPWASLWLRFFELWLVTNTWEGSGAPYAG